MIRLRESVAFRLAAICGALVIGSIIVFAGIFYFGTVGVLDEQVDNKIEFMSHRLTNSFQQGGLETLQKEITLRLNDGVDSNIEIYFLEASDGRKIVGNLPALKISETLDEPINQTIIRDDRRFAARLFLHRLPNGCLLVVGRTMNDLNKITTLVLRTIGLGLVAAILLAIGGTIFFRRQLERRVGTIRHGIEEIISGSGNLAKRISTPAIDDEFSLLSNELNRMLDKIENLMAGVRNISNTVAHNIRTPLGRIRGHLDEALRSGVDKNQLTKVAEFSIEQVDALIIILDKLLQIAESESGAHCLPFETVALQEVVTNVVELYDAIAEAKDIALFTKIEGEPVAMGDKDLLATAFANLLDNALKYGARSVIVYVKEIKDLKIASLIVQDNGPGIPAEERLNVIQRFYRLNRTVPGSGLGLSIVSAIAHLHGATLRLEDAAPGLRACLDLPSGKV